MNRKKFSSTRTWRHLLAAILVAFVTMCGLATEAAASSNVSIIPFPPIGIGIDRRQPPQACTPLNDGEEIVWDGWVWVCSFVAGDTPPWQWEPLHPA